jgi:hypothetical protein
MRQISTATPEHEILFSDTLVGVYKNFQHKDHGIEAKIDTGGFSLIAVFLRGTRF